MLEMINVCSTNYMLWTLLTVHPSLWQPGEKMSDHYIQTRIIKSFYCLAEKFYYLNLTDFIV